MKIMLIDDLNEEEPIAIDVSTIKLLNKAKIFLFKEYLKNEIEGLIDDDIDTYKNDECKYCKGTGKLKQKKEIIICKNCIGINENIEQLNKNIEMFNLAKSNNIKAIDYWLDVESSFIPNIDILNIRKV